MVVGQRDSTQSAVVNGIAPYVHVEDLARSMAFYELLGCRVIGTFQRGGSIVWAHLDTGDGRLMLAKADGPIQPDQQAVLFYLYAPDVAALRERLVGEGIAVGPIANPDHMVEGEIRLSDPDGYVLLVGQTGTG